MKSPRRIPGFERRVFRGWGRLLGLACCLAACASPVPSLWPAAPGGPTKDVIVSVDTWHAVIGFPRAADAGLRSAGQESPSSAASPARTAQSFFYEEWGYAELGWYLEERQGITGALRALFWPSAGVIEVGTHAQPWSERTPDPPAELFRFELSEEGYLRLRTFLTQSRRSEVPLHVGGTRAFFPATRAYSVFHQCHQFAAQALRAGGLPVSPAWALTRSALVVQLRRAERLAVAPAQRNPAFPAVGTTGSDP